MVLPDSYYKQLYKVLLWFFTPILFVCIILTILQLSELYKKKKDPKYKYIPYTTDGIIGLGIIYAVCIIAIGVSSHFYNKIILKEKERERKLADLKKSRKI